MKVRNQTRQFGFEVGEVNLEIKGKMATIKFIGRHRSRMSPIIIEGTKRELGALLVKMGYDLVCRGL